MDRGAIVSGRFRVEGRQAVGGMGEVHLAVDLQTQHRVALKILRSHGDAIEARFAREAAVLSELSHPGIVRYISHGRTVDGESYLAMEWLDGELLSERLRRGPMSVADSLALIRRVAEALASAHARRIVHRDLKPGNLLLEGGALEHVKILDFGLARNDASSLLVLTRTGELAGTPGYMAPEQARGLHDVDTRADIYSLGCVLFECLTGRPAFSGDHVYAVLAKILVEPAPRVSDLSPDVPAAVEELVERMLAKHPGERPADAGDLLGELAQVTTAASAQPSAPSRRGLGRAEQRVMCVILAAGELDPDGEPDRPTARTINEQDHRAAQQALDASVRAYGGALDRLAGGHVVVTFGGAGTATDLAARAARCALAVAAFLPDKQVAVATGRGVAHERLPLGAAIDEAASLIARAGSEPFGGSASRGSSPSLSGDHPLAPAWLPVRLDDVTAGLLDTRFELGATDGAILLLGFAEYREAERTLLGRPSPFVGREREVANLLGIVDECRAEPLAQPVLVIGPAGAGKSRLRSEVLRRMQDDEPAQVWIGRGDPMSSGAPLSLLAQMIRREAGILHGEPPRQARRKLRARIGRHVPAEHHDRVTVFLGEMCGIPFADDRRPELRAARGDASAMGDQMRRAWEDLVAAECGAGALILILEDLHWGDLPTVKFVDAALRTQAQRPLMVLALARPEVSDRFPDLWSGRGLQVVTLRPLTERAARKLVEQTLGGRADEDTIKKLIERASGNPFYLEELIRAAANGHDNPGTVLAMIGGRLESLPGEHRRLIRAASVMGESFWPGALHALLGRDDGWIAAALGELVEHEWLVRRAESVHAEQTEYAFRHTLVREAAYAMLTDDDRRLGHRLAAEWLQESGGTEALTIGEHFERGGEPGRAVGWYLRAAKQALDGTDLTAAAERARIGLRCAELAADLDADADTGSRARAATSPGHGGDELGQLRGVLAEAYNWNGLNAEAETDGLAALALLPIGGSPWYAAASQVAVAAGRLGHLDRVIELAETLRAAAVPLALSAPWLRAAEAAAVMLVFHGVRYDLADVLLERMAEVLPTAADADPSLPARVEVVHGLRAGARGDLGACLRELSDAAAAFERIGHHRRAAVQRHDVGFTCLELGGWERSERELRRALEESEQLGMVRLGATARQNLGLAVARRGRFDEAERFERESIAMFREQGEPRMEAGSYQYLGIVLLLAGNLEAAEAAVVEALALERRPTPARTMSLGVLSQILLACGRPDDALAASDEAMEILTQLGGGIVEGESRVRLAWAEALHATGNLDQALAAIITARDRLRELAARISDLEIRDSFVTAVPENARTFALARAWSNDALPAG